MSIQAKKFIAVSVVSILLFILANYLVLISVKSPAEIQGWNPFFITTWIFAQHSGNGPFPQVVVLSHVLNFPFFAFWFAIAGNLLCILPKTDSPGATLATRKVKQAINANLVVVAVYVSCNILMWLFIGLGNAKITNYSLLSVSTGANYSLPMLPFYAFWLAIVVNLYCLFLQKSAERSN